MYLYIFFFCQASTIHYVIMRMTAPDLLLKPGKGCKHHRGPHHKHPAHTHIIIIIVIVNDNDDNNMMMMMVVVVMMILVTIIVPIINIIIHILISVYGVSYSRHHKNKNHSVIIIMTM